MFTVNDLKLLISIKFTEHDDYNRVCALYDTTPSDNWQENWRNWLSQENEVDAEQLKELNSLKVPTWAYYSAAHIPNNMEVIPDLLVSYN